MALIWTHQFLDGPQSQPGATAWATRSGRRAKARTASPVRALTARESQNCFGGFTADYLPRPPPPRPNPPPRLNPPLPRLNPPPLPRDMLFMPRLELLRALAPSKPRAPPPNESRLPLPAERDRSRLPIRSEPPRDRLLPPAERSPLNPPPLPARLVARVPAPGRKHTASLRRSQKAP
jgi:hypothetical protein